MAEAERAQRRGLFILWCLAIIGFAASQNYYLSAVVLFFAGILSLAFMSMAQTLVQLQAPTQLRGRLIGYSILPTTGSRLSAA